MFFCSIMRRILLLLMMFMLLMPNAKGASSLGNPTEVNKMISIIETPQLAPGEKGPVELTLFNPYVNNMTNVSLTASLYLYVSWDEEKPVDSSWSWDEPYFEEDGKGIRDHTWSFTTLEPGVMGQQNLTATFVTSLDAPHGGILNQGSYFVRFQLEFDYVHPLNGTSEHALMRSRGYFTDQEWEFATQDPQVQDDPNYLGGLNLTHLGVSGILPDTSFAVLEPFPVWIFYVLVIAAVISLIFALLFYLEENPDKWPWLANRWIRVRSSMKQSRRISRKKKEDASSRKKV
jgi:hypothetical protein